MNIYRNLEATQNEIFNSIHDIPADAAKAVSVMLKELATELETIDRIRNVTSDDKTAITKHFKQLEAIPLQIETMVSGGDSYDVARGFLSRKYGYPPETVDLYWKKHKARHQKRVLGQRNMIIMQRARSGWTNEMISHEVGISTRQIQRVISKELGR